MLDLRGEYQENKNIGTAVFTQGAHGEPFEHAFGIELSSFDAAIAVSRMPVGTSPGMLATIAPSGRAK